MRACAENLYGVTEDGVPLHGSLQAALDAAQAESDALKAYQ